MDRNEACHETYMKRALELAQTAMGRTSPNPMVGCVVVKNGSIVAEGCHEKYGAFHAERNALTKCAGDVSGADLYVTLEPCCHQGKTPPCTDIIIEKRIGRVFVGAMDPNPKVAGNGVRILREHGIEVVPGVLEQECLALNEIFFHYIRSGVPFVAMKYAMTLDGKIAACTGDSKWVTGEKAREHVQLLRKKYASIMVGVDTVIADDPMLNCRMWEGVDPVRVICDSHLRIPLESQIVRTAGDIKTIVAYAGGTDGQKVRELEKQGEKALELETRELEMRELEIREQKVRELEKQGEKALELETRELEIRERKVRELEKQGEKALELETRELEIRERKVRELEASGLELLKAGEGSRVSLEELIRQLGRRNIDSVLVEGGGSIHGSLLETGLVNRVYAYIAPKLIGGKDAKSPVEGNGIREMAAAKKLTDMTVMQLGEDLCVTGLL